MAAAEGAHRGLEARLQTVLRPSLQQYLALLPLALGDLEATIEGAVAANPLLVRSPGGPCLGCGRHCANGTWCAACSAAPLPADPAAPVGWRDRLEGDARLELPARAHPVLALVVGSLDDHGLLAPGSLPGGLDPAGVAEAVAALRRVGPPGVAAASPLECVRLQVDELVAGGVAPALAARLFAERASDLAAGRPDAAAAALGVEEDAVAAALAAVRDRVTPYVVLDEPGPRPVAVDVTFRLDRDADRLVVEVVDAAWFGVGIDQDLWAWASGEARAWLRPHHADAVRVLAELRARAGMLHRLAVLLADRQQAFILQGPSAHRPLSRAEAARALDCHPSTVGRAVADKWARCPDGRVLGLDAFFGGQTAALLAVRELLDTLPGASDEQLRGLLADRGIVLARRTVTKYRHLLGMKRASSMPR